MLQLCAALVRVKQGRDKGRCKPREHTHQRLATGTGNNSLPIIHVLLKFHCRKCDVLNRGFSGYNTRWAKIILPSLIREGNSLDTPVAVTIFFGANDSALKGKGIFVFLVQYFYVIANLCTFFNCYFPVDKNLPNLQ